jgi:hypothetical protein
MLKVPMVGVFWMMELVELAFLYSAPWLLLLVSCVVGSWLKHVTRGNISYR